MAPARRAAQQSNYFRSLAFRPVRPTSIETFRKLLNPVPETV
jgi:hypothetical protein